MRKIDTEAYNKRLHTEIMELDKMIKSINPENLNQIDAGLIKTADEYIRLISDTVWADNSNFNGIEMHKIKQLMNSLKADRKKAIVRSIILSSPDMVSNGKQFNLSHSIKIEAGYDGRNSLFIPRVLWRDTETAFYLYPYRNNALVAKNVSFKHVITKNKNTISFDFSCQNPMQETAGTSLSYYQGYLQIFYILWK